MAYRSEGNRIPNKQYYTDLNLTHYPSALDTRLNNVNMKGFTNVGESSIPDYVMAEYVNSLADAVMALERAIGTNPMVPTGANPNQIPNFINTKTISDRIASIEGGNLDERYGGVGWRYVPGRPTLNNHQHDGLNGHPGKINLQTEVEGLLRKHNIDLTLASGLTGSDIFVSRTNGTKIDQAFLDALSKKSGGTVEGPTNFMGGFRTLTMWEGLAPSFQGRSGTSNAADGTATSSQVAQAGGTNPAIFHRENITKNLMYGKYVIGVRAKVSSNGFTNNVIAITAGGQTSNFTGKDFKGSNVYQTIYHVFEHNKTSEFKIEKIATSSAITVSIDSYFIQPIHPAVFDR